jgi:hypothetical protein
MTDAEFEKAFRKQYGEMVNLFSEEMKCKIREAMETGKIPEDEGSNEDDDEPVRTVDIYKDLLSTMSYVKKMKFLGEE